MIRMEVKTLNKEKEYEKTIKSLENKYNVSDIKNIGFL